MEIDPVTFTRQRALIRKMVMDLECGRTAFAIKRDLPDLTSILGTLDFINDCNNLDGVDDPNWEQFSDDDAGPDDSFSHLDDYAGPECPGCTTFTLCDDCEYLADPAVDPVCEN
jgi:hypothetical protein